MVQLISKCMFIHFSNLRLQPSTVTEKYSWPVFVRFPLSLKKLVEHQNLKHLMEWIGLN
ncbi:hypothetical protein FOCC_FOCC002253, partial [Frankliniella occidentalis]